MKNGVTSSRTPRRQIQAQQRQVHGNKRTRRLSRRSKVGVGPRRSPQGLSQVQIRRDPGGERGCLKAEMKGNRGLLAGFSDSQKAQSQSYDGG